MPNYPKGDVKTQVILPTAGKGTRLKSDLIKPLVMLCGKPLFVYALEVFENSPEIDSVILVGNKDKLSEFEHIVLQHNLKKVSKIVAGGETRCESVSCGLAQVDDDTEIVMVHDGARPLVSLQTIENVLSLCQKWDAVVTAVPVQPTIKRVNKDNLSVEETLNREELWEIQTPQVFKKDILIEAHKLNKELSPTDDAAMVEKLGVKVKVSLGDLKNIKVTTQEDLAVAEVFLQQRKVKHGCC